MSLQLIIALNWKEDWVGGAQAFYKEQRNLLTENRTGQAASADNSCWESKKGGELGSTKASPVQTLHANQQL